MSVVSARGFRAATAAVCAVALLVPNVALANATVATVNNSLLDTVRTVPTPPPRFARAMAMVGISMFDAVNAGASSPYQGYSYTGGPVTGVSQEALAISAGYTMMANLFPAVSVDLGTQMTTQLNALAIDSAVRAASLAFGQSVANNFFNARAGDGASVAQIAYVPGTDPGDFQPLAPNPVLPGWGDVSTFAASSATQFSSGAPPVLGSAEWIADYNSVRLLGYATCGTPEQQTIARFWADGGGTFTPPGHWLDIATGLMTSLSILEAARLTALVGIAVADAGITAWETKYEYNTWRPVTAINTCTDATCGVDGEPGWVPLLGTPNFPSYVSGHSSFSGAAAGAIAGFFGTDDIAFCTPADPASGVVGDRCFDSLRDAADEAGISRIYGGIHYEHDNGRAVDAGYALGTFVASSQLAAVPEPSSWSLLIAGFGLIGATLRRRRQAPAA